MAERPVNDIYKHGRVILEKPLYIQDKKKVRIKTIATIYRILAARHFTYSFSKIDSNSFWSFRKGSMIHYETYRGVEKKMNKVTVTTSVARGGGGRGPPIMLFLSFVGTFGNVSVLVSGQACHLY